MMEEAEKRIRLCILNNEETLQLNGLRLRELPVLPNHIKSLYCYANALTTLPKLPPGLVRLECWSNLLTALPELPDTLEYLYCSNNQITSLPKLPTKLKELYCNFNLLIKLPELPNSLIHLACIRNKLIALPKLPNLHLLYCRGHPYLNIQEEIIDIEAGELKITPNYPIIVNCLKHMKKAIRRKQKLEFCDKLQVEIDGYVYRPMGLGYTVLKERNKGKFLDLL